MADFVAYFRVSTNIQGHSGLGLDAQKSAVACYIRDVGGSVVARFEEIESGANVERPRLAEALRVCKQKKAILVIAKLDRLARSVHMISELMKSGVAFVAADMPHANRLTVHIIAAVAEYEREMISQRTKAALMAAKARGVRLGNPRIREQSQRAADQTVALADDYAKALLPFVEALKAQGISSYAKLACALQAQGLRTRRGGLWHPSGVRNIVKRLDSLAR